MSERSSLLGRFILLAATGLVGPLIGIGIILAFEWPFTKPEFVRTLEHFSSCEVKVTHFQQTFLPHPGYVAENVTFSRTFNGREIEMASVKRIEASGSWSALVTFTHRLKELRLEGLHVFIPAPVPRPIPFYPDMKARTTVSTLVANGSVLEIAPRKGDGRPLRFGFRKLVLGEVKKEKSISLDTVLQIPEPPGEITARARFGPFEKGRLADMPLWGSYELKNTDLRHTEAINGMLTSKGSFRGVLSRCTVRGSVRIHNFEINNVRHPVELDSDFDTTVDGLHGDVSIDSSKVRFLGTVLKAVGTVQTRSGERGKTASLAITGDNARVEDLLRIFVKSIPPALRGPIRLRANIALPPGPKKFLRKLRLDGEFKISQAEFLHPKTRRSVDKLSLRARGRKVKEESLADENVLSSLEASVHLRNGTATLSNADFKTRGATASGGGTYNLLTQEIDLRGKLAMEASLSKAAGGIKSVLLIPLDPFFKKAHAGAVLPIHATGTYSHPSFHVSLRGK